MGNDNLLRNPLPLSLARQVSIPPALPTLRESERTLIVQTLESVGWA